MKLGVLFPQTDFGADPGAIRDYSQTAKDLGYESLGLYEHVLGARPERRAEQWVSCIISIRFTSRSRSSVTWQA